MTKTSEIWKHLLAYGLQNMFEIGDGKNKKRSFCAKRTKYGYLFQYAIKKK